MSNRGGGGFGPAPLTHRDMLAFFELSQIDPVPWEIELIEALDSRYLASIAEDKTKES